MKTIVYFGVPALGHVSPSLPYIAGLVARGWQVIYYTTPDFESRIKDTGAKFRSYPPSAQPDEIVQLKNDLTDGQHLARAWTIALKISRTVMPDLLEEVSSLSPQLIIHDSTNMMGRFAGHFLNIPAIAFHAILPVLHPFDKTARLYNRFFILPLMLNFRDLLTFYKEKRKFKKAFSLSKLSIFSLSFNLEKLNLFAFNQPLLPAKAAAQEYFFAGPLDTLVNMKTVKRIPLPSRPFIYVTLGTIAKDEEFIQAVLDQLADLGADVIFALGDNPLPKSCPDNVFLYPFVNQQEILPFAKLVVSTGGLNTINHAIKAKIPLLIYPSQGEQKLNAERVESLGLGKRLKSLNHLKSAVIAALEQDFDIKPDLYQDLTALRLEEALDRTEKYIKACSTENEK
ncbi:nucleotide disphospho-sugar-binding domain-containing protein [Lactovum odontotermitis]